MMKRKEEEQEKKVRFRKTGGGTFRIGNRIIKQNQVFDEYPSKIPPNFRDLCVPVDGSVFPPTGDMVADETERIAKVKAEEPTYRKEPVKSEYELESGEEMLYDIYNNKGKKMNEISVTSQEADNLLEQLNLEEA